MSSNRSSLLANFIEVSTERSKLGIKLSKSPEPASEDERVALLDLLVPALEAAGVNSEGTREAVAEWLRDSSPVHHSVSNIQIGDGFVSLYRHPSTFGHIDPNVPEQHEAFRRALGRQRELRATDDDIVPLTVCMSFSKDGLTVVKENAQHLTCRVVLVLGLHTIFTIRILHLGL